MVRRHGWQLPAHTFQVIAITMYFILEVAFYAFFAPFLRYDVVEYIMAAVYTPVALTVFILYVRCTYAATASTANMEKGISKGHGVPDSMIREVRDITRTFFALPTEEKLKIKMTPKRGYRGYQKVGENINKGKA